MKRILLLAFLCLPITVVPQEQKLKRDNELYALEAEKLTRAYAKELQLNGPQKILFKRKLLETLIRTQELTTTRIGTPQPNILHLLKKEEANAMRTILSKQQYTLYMLLRDQLQPPLEGEGEAEVVVEQ
jgi:hypothetical protein